MDPISIALLCGAGYCFYRGIKALIFRDGKISIPVPRISVLNVKELKRYVELKKEYDNARGVNKEKAEYYLKMYEQELGDSKVKTLNGFINSISEEKLNQILTIDEK